VYALTAQGRAACDQAYDDLALAALRFMSEEFGHGAVAAFAQARAEHLAQAAGPVPTDPQTLAASLSGAGYAAEVTPLGDLAVQLCQHHCPVVDAAREFPVLCEAETEALSRALGRHVTRLATLAAGDEVCTAVIPATAPAPLPVDPARRTSHRRVPA
jgi:predicted ArsR family transcriptional regulator